MGNTELLFPRGWKPLKGKECFSIISSASLSALIEDENGDVLYLKVDDFNNPKNLNSVNDSKIKVKAQEKANGVVPIGAIIVSKRGEAIRKNRVKITNRKAYLDPNLMAIKIFEEHNNVFFKYLIEQMNLQRFLEDSAIPQLNNKDFYPRNFIIPEKQKEQTAIAYILSKVDEAIEATQNSIKAAEKLKKALMQNLLSGKLKPDGTWRNDDEFYVDEKFGKVPNGWDVKKVKDVFHVNQDSLPSKTDANFTFKYITIESVETEYIDFKSCPEYKFKESPGRARRIIKNGDILISGVRPNLKAFAIYESPNNENWICSTGFYVLTAKKNENNRYYFYQILSEIGERQFHSYVAGSNYPAIGDRDIKNLKLYSPTFPEQCLIDSKLSSISNESALKIKKIKTLQRLKKSLMQNLLTGKVRVDIEEINKILSEQ